MTDSAVVSPVSNTYKQRRQAGLCGRCGSEPEAGFKSCAACRARENDIKKKREAEDGKTRHYLRKEAGLCVGCGKVPPMENRVLCASCRELHSACRNRTLAAGECRDCGGPREREDITFCNRCSQANIDRAAIWRQSLRDEAFAAYGGYRCACCGESNKAFLQFDHINNDGAEHRKEVGGGCTLYQWLKQNNFPSGFQVLCANCNWGKRTTGVCPHKLQADQDIAEGYDNAHLVGYE